MRNYVIVRKIRVHMNTCLIQHGYRERAVGMCRHNHIRILLVVGWKSEFYKRKMDTREELLACTSGAAACIKTWRWTQPNNTRSSRTSCKVHWGWRWDFVDIYCDLLQICYLNIKLILNIYFCIAIWSDLVIVDSISSISASIQQHMYKHVHRNSSHTVTDTVTSRNKQLSH